MSQETSLANNKNNNTAAWTKTRRHGNDELPSDRAAVKIIRTTQIEQSPSAEQSVSRSPKKSTVTKVSKLVYEPKTTPTRAVLRSVRTYKKNPSTNSLDSGNRQDSDTNRTQDKAFESIKQDKKTDATENINQTSIKKRNRDTNKNTISEIFAKKRLEREKEISEIQDMLKEITVDQETMEKSAGIYSTPQKESRNLSHDVKLQKRKTNIPPPIAERSKTEPNITVPKKGNTSKDQPLNTTRSKSTTNIESKRSTVSASSQPKQKSYDPEKAKRYMQEQKEKRKTAKQNNATKKQASKIDREEIKKRLENLKKNTRQILNKNLNKGKKTNSDGPPIPSDRPSSFNLEITVASTEKIPAKRSSVESIQKVLYPMNKESGRRIGLLRKTNADNDDDDASPVLPDVNNKENMGVNLNSPQTPVLSKINNEIEKPESIRIERPVEVKPLTNKTDLFIAPKSESNQVTITNGKHSATNMTDLHLSVPDMALKPKTTLLCEKSTQFEPPPPEKPQIPTWLQPTPVQFYPYNFIMAVRKKLEAITNPVLNTKTESCLNSAKIIIASPSGSRIESIITSPEKKKFEIITNSSSIVSPEFKIPQAPVAAKDHSRTISEITSNFSSVSVHVQESNTISEVSSIQSHSESSQVPKRFSSTKIWKKSTEKQNEDDTTASSSVFSSPEKHNRKPKEQSSTVSEIIEEVTPNHSPLSIESINRLTIKSKTFTKSDNTDKELKIPSVSLRLKDYTKKSQLGDEKTDADFEQLLEDFNKSLSQVIEVNQKLQHTLDRSHSIAKDRYKTLKRSVRTPRVIKSKSSKSDCYSSDFEDAATSAKTTTTRTTEEEIKTNEDSNAESVSKNTEKSKSTTNEEIVTESDRTKSTTIEENRSENSKSTQQDEIKSESEKSITSSRQQNNKSTTNSKRSTGNTLSTRKSVDTNEDGATTTNTVSPTNHNSNFNIKSRNISEESIEEKVRTFELSPEKSSFFSNFSRDSLEPDESKTKEEIIRNQINTVRGDDYPYTKELNIFIEHRSSSRQTESKPSMSDTSIANNRGINSSIGSDIFAIFNHSEMEVSLVSQTSESPMNFSTLGLYEQLLKTENIKTDHLTSLLKIREKSLLDRTKGQIALLEIQKQKCKAKGLTLQISTIRKKQRAILLKMEKEREEIRRILKSTASQPDTQRKKLIRPRIPQITSEVAIKKNNSSIISTTSSRSTSMLKGLELENSSKNLEQMLIDRETELQRRRRHVERLVKWHQRLDREEEDVLQMEQMLYLSNKQKEPKSSKNYKKEKKINEIDRSLKELQSISSKNDDTKRTEEYACTSGSKLNKLWRRLTGSCDMRFDQMKKYKLSKLDLEKLYEDAKKVVLEEFDQNDELQILSRHSRVNTSLSTMSSRSYPESNETNIPRLDLNFSSGQSESEKAGSINSAKTDLLSIVEIDSGKNSIRTISPEQTEKVPYEEMHLSGTEENSSSDKPLDVIISNGTSPTTPSNNEYTSNFQSSTERKTSSVPSMEITSSSASSEVTSIREIDEVKIHSTEHIPEETTTESASSITTPDKLEATPIESPTSINSSEKLESEKISEIIELTNVENSSNQANAPEDKSETPHSISPISSAPMSSSPTQIENNDTDITTPSEILPSTETNISEAEIIDIPEDNVKQTTIGDFTKANETMIEDITLPKFEITMNEPKSLDEELPSPQSPVKTSEIEEYSPGISEDNTPTELEQRLIDLDDSLKDLHHTFERALSPDKLSVSPSNSTNPTTISNDDEDKENNRPCSQSYSSLDPSNSILTTVKDYLLNTEASSNLMPDIISEVELRRRQQILMESDIKQLEHAVPYVFLREIPNKPPPPYVPPAHGSPMTTIFPSENRIKEITFRRTKELFEEYTKIDKETAIACQPIVTILDENITNIYERIILDICKECIQDYQPTLTVNTTLEAGSYKMPLALFNPPDRLECLQDFIYKKIRKFLGMDKKTIRRSSIFLIGRRKRDHVDDILIQELFEEEYKWTNFDLEETEVKAGIIDEIFNDLVKEILENSAKAINKKKMVLND